MSIGIFIDDAKSGKDAIRELARKVLGANNVSRRVHITVTPRGDKFSAEKMRAYAIPLLKQHTDVAKIVICVDSECTEPESIRRRLSSVKVALAGYGLGVDFRYVVVVHALEGWLAADSDAVGQVLDRDVSGRIPGNRESVCKPADFLSDLFGKRGKDFRKTEHNAKIAALAEPARILSRNASFGHFRKVIADP